MSKRCDYICFADIGQAYHLLWTISAKPHRPSRWTGEPLSSMSVQGLAVDPETTDRFNIIMPKSAGIYGDKHPEEIITRFLQTEEEADELSTLSTDINTYVKESMVRFATGEMPLTEWDNYVETLNSMGLDRYTELLQAGYDRANGK